MPTPDDATKRFIECAEQHIVEQQARIRCQRELIAILERENHEELLDEARALLEQMLGSLHQMETAYVSAVRRVTVLKNRETQKSKIAKARNLQIRKKIGRAKIACHVTRSAVQETVTIRPGAVKPGSTTDR
jgi:hypothetical protein